MKFSASSKSLAIAALLIMGTVTGCSSTGSIPLIESNGFDWFASDEVTLSENLSGYENPTLRANGSDVEMAVANAIELSRQKRFAEARHILSGLRQLQPIGSEAYEALTCSMAITALRSGEIDVFIQLAGELDDITGNQVRANPEYVDVISLYRIVSGEALPVNARSGFNTLKHRYFATEGSDA